MKVVPTQIGVLDPGPQSGAWQRFRAGLKWFFAPAERREIDGNTATGTLKLIAVIFMFCDHAGKMLFSHYGGMTSLPSVPELRIIGRLAFPIYCWCMAVGFSYTRNALRYILRVLAVGLVSQPLYCIALDHPLTKPNIMLTLAVALLGLWFLRERKALPGLWKPLGIVLAAGTLMLAEVLGCDYGWKGVLLVYLLYAARTSRPAIAAVMVGFCLYWGSSSSVVSTLFGMNTAALRNPNTPWGALLSPWLKLQALAVNALPFMLIRMKNIRMHQAIGYLLYPLHLVLLEILRLLLV